MATDKPKRPQINLRVPDETREKLAVLAETDGRTIAREFQWLVDQEWKKRKKQKHDP